MNSYPKIEIQPTRVTKLTFISCTKAAQVCLLAADSHHAQVGQGVSLFLWLTHAPATVSVTPASFAIYLLSHHLDHAACQEGNLSQEAKVFASIGKACALMEV